jgi:large subunit ribosomal protein L15
MNGAGSRSGTKDKRGFEGGQMPLQRRVPKIGFKNINRVDYVEFNLSKLQHIADKYNVNAIDFEFLRKNRYVQKDDVVKVLGKGELKAKLTVTLHAASETAKKGIEAAGGSFNAIA